MSNLFFIALWSFLFLQACDPCRQASNMICDCRGSENEILKCKADLNLANSQKFFESGKDDSICLNVLQSCTCEDVLQGNYEKCGFSREN